MNKQNVIKIILVCSTNTTTACNIHYIIRGNVSQVDAAVLEEGALVSSRVHALHTDFCISSLSFSDKNISGSRIRNIYLVPWRLRSTLPFGIAQWDEPIGSFILLWISNWISFKSWGTPGQPTWKNIVCIIRWSLVNILQLCAESSLVRLLPEWIKGS